jgi:hypothetical protein
VTALALIQTTEALRARLNDVLGVGSVHVGAPLKGERQNRTVSLYLYNIQPNRDLRNVDRHTPAPPGAPPGGLLPIVDALPVDLRYLISVFRENPLAEEPTELARLGLIMRALHAEPTLSGSALPGQTVRLTPEPYAINELKEIWGLFPDEPYRTSVVYLATPVFIELDALSGPVVLERKLDAGVQTLGEAA